MLVEAPSATFKKVIEEVIGQVVSRTKDPRFQQGKLEQSINGYLSLSKTSSYCNLSLALKKKKHLWSLVRHREHDCYYRILVKLILFHVVNI